MSQVNPNHSWRMALQKIIMKTIATDKKARSSANCAPGDDFDDTPPLTTVLVASTQATRYFDDRRCSRVFEERMEKSNNVTPTSAWRFRSRDEEGKPPSLKRLWGRVGPPSNYT